MSELSNSKKNIDFSNISFLINKIIWNITNKSAVNIFTHSCHVLYFYTVSAKT